jgi:hemolysin activation/secretion protein
MKTQPNSNHKGNSMKPTQTYSRNLRPMLATLALTFTPLAHAAPTGANTFLQQVQPNGEVLPPSAPFLVKHILITDNTSIGTATLQNLVAQAEGQQLTLPLLNAYVTQIIDYYHRHGYPLARAFIPAQNSHDGNMTVYVVEAPFGVIHLDNHSRVNTPLLLDAVSSLHSGSVVERGSLNHDLLLLSVIAVQMSATLKPGLTVGTSGLNLVANPTPGVNGSVTTDNYGNAYTGRAILGGTVNFIDLLHPGDVLNVNGLTTGASMNYAHLSYETPVNGDGTRVGGSYVALHYMLGSTLSNLDGYGTAEIGSLWAKQPLIRSGDLSLYGQLQYDHLYLLDNIGASNIHTDRQLDNLTASLYGDASTKVSNSTWNLGVTSGRVDYSNNSAQLADATSANTQGSFTRGNASFTYLQALNTGNAVYLALSGQAASTNLDLSQQMIAGGPYTVRAYDMGVLSGDSGCLGTLELRHDLGDMHGQWQLVGFYDTETLQVNKSLWAGAGSTNSATLSGAGVGVNWLRSDQWGVKAYVAARLETPSVLIGSAPAARAWLEVSKGF